MDPLLAPSPTETTGRWLRRLPSKDFARLMGASIEASLVLRGRCTALEARLLGQDALQRFANLLAKRTRRVRAVTKAECLAELERTHADLLRRSSEHERELTGLEHELAHARRGGEAGIPAEEDRGLSEALAEDLRVHFGRGLDEEALQHVLVRERVRRMAVLGNHAQRAAERIDTLERRITKLRAALQDTERSLAELARRVELDTGVPSIYSEVQGLSSGDALREAKAAMLACVFEANLALQRRSG